MFFILKYDVLLAWRAGQTILCLYFLCLLVVLLPFGFGPHLDLLRQLGIPLLWLGLLLASLLSQERMFKEDMLDGSLTLSYMAGMSFELVALVKSLAHFVAVGLPLVLSVPFLGLLLNLELVGLLPLCGSLILGALGFSLLGSLGACLVVSIERGGLLLAVLVLPFSIPFLIFGIGAAQGMSQAFWVLLGLDMVCMLLLPLIMGYVLRLGMQ